MMATSVAANALLDSVTGNWQDKCPMTSPRLRKALTLAKLTLQHLDRGRDAVLQEKNMLRVAKLRI